MTKNRTKLTPPQVAERLGVGVLKVLTWIRSGELVAFNAATKAGGRPRYKVDLSDLAEFERRRQVLPVQPIRRLRRRPVGGVIEFV